jgi:hypothetical protein
MKIFAIGFIFLAFIFVAMPQPAFSQEEEILEEEEVIQENTQPDKKPTKKQEEEILEEEINTEIQDEGELKKSIKETYYKDKYEKTYDYAFEIVWEAIKKSLADKNCQIAHEKYTQTDEGLYKGSIKSDFCVFAAVANDEDVFDSLKVYSLEVPFIRGGIWLNGRMEYKFKLKENDDGSVYVRLKGKLSGFEDFVTHEVHFWQSNGYFETKMLEAIEKNCKLLSQE